MGIACVHMHCPEMSGIIITQFRVNMPMCVWVCVSGSRINNCRARPATASALISRVFRACREGAKPNYIDYMFAARVRTLNTQCVRTTALVCGLVWYSNTNHHQPCERHVRAHCVCVCVCMFAGTFQFRRACKCCTI